MNTNLSHPIAELLFRSLRGELSEKEQETLDLWRSISEKNEAVYNKVHEEGYIDRELKIFIEGSKKNTALWENIQKDYTQRQQTKKTVRKQFQKKRSLQISPSIAVIAIIIALFIVMTPYIMCQTIIDTLSAKALNIHPGNFKAKLYLEDGRTVELASIQQNPVIEGVNATSARLTDATSPEEDRSTWQTIKIPRGATYSVQLSDSTEVFLNSESELHYPVYFTGKTREVRLKGEGFFKVVPNAKKPFIIHTDTIQVEILDASCNINTYHPERLEIAVTEGEVMIRTKDNKKEWSVKSSQLASLYPDKQNIEIKQVDIWPYIAWKEGQLVFKNQRMEEIMEKLSRYYDITVEFQDPAIKGQRYSGTFKEQSIQKVLESITAAINVKYKIDEKTVTFYQ